MLNNKRGISVNWLMWIAVITLLTIFYLVLEASLNRVVKQTVDLNGLEGDILYNRLFFSDASFFYKDEISDRHYIGIIKESEIDTKFSEKTLTKLFDKDSNFNIAFKLQLETKDEIIKTIYYNKEILDTGVAISHIENSRYQLVERVVPVSILKDNLDHELAVLRITQVTST